LAVIGAILMMTMHSAMAIDQRTCMTCNMYVSFTCTSMAWQAGVVQAASHLLCHQTCPAANSRPSLNSSQGTVHSIIHRVAYLSFILWPPPANRHVSILACRIQVELLDAATNDTLGVIQTLSTATGYSRAPPGRPWSYCLNWGGMYTQPDGSKSMVRVLCSLWFDQRYSHECNSSSAGPLHLA
jgi:hypothetical protein